MRTILAAVVLAAAPCAFALNPDLDVSQYAHFGWRFRGGFLKGTIQKIVQTRDGYLWLGTSSGLQRFDGVKVVPWPQNPSLPSNIIRTMVESRDGTLWIGTLNGLVSWKDGKLTTYPEFTDQAIFGLVEDREGTIWAGGYSGASGKFCEIRDGAVRCHPEMGVLDHGVLGLREDRAGNLWVGLLSGVWRWKPGAPRFYPVPGELNGILGMADSEGGGILIGTTGAVRKLQDGKSEIAFPFPAPLRTATSTWMLRDRDGGIWVGTNGRGIVHFHHGKTDVFTQADGLTGSGIYDFFEDCEGNVWVATDAGLDRFRELPVVTYTQSQGLSGTPSGPVLAAKNGRVWFGTNRGLNSIKDGEVAAHDQRGGSGLPDPHSRSLYEDLQGRIWVSSGKDVGYLDNDRFVPAAVPGGQIDGILEDRAGNLWVANQDEGLFESRPDGQVQKTPWNALGHLSPADAMALDPSPPGLWLGFSNGGILLYDGAKIQASYSASDGLAAGRIYQLQFDKDGALWIAAAGGLSRLKHGRFATLSSKNGLACDKVLWLVEDEDHSFWLGMPCGLTRVTQSDLATWKGDPSHAIQPLVLDEADGARMPAEVGGYTPRASKAPDGKVWFEISEGISVVDPRRIASNKLAPPVHVESVIADRKAVSNFRLPALTRDLEIDYTALSLVAPEKNRFKYKLEGHDRDWIDAGDRRQAFYNDLPPRKYRFRVIASNNSGVWNETGDTLEFSIAPAYYQTNLFKALIAALVLAAAWGLYRLRLYQIAREFNLRLEERVSERTRLARDLHDTLLQSFHGLMLRFQAVSKLLPEGKAKEQLDKTLERADQAIAEGRSAVYDLRASTTETNELSEALNAVGNELSKDDAAEFSLVVEGEARDLHPIIRDELYRIGREALSNAFKHAHARHVEAEIEYGERVFRLRIRDDGEGMPAEIVEEGRPGHYGLPGIRERARQAGADLTIWSRARSGTEIDLSLAGSIAYGTPQRQARFQMFKKKAG